MHSRIEVIFSVVDEHKYMTQKYLGLYLKKKRHLSDKFEVQLGVV